MTIQSRIRPQRLRSGCCIGIAAPAGCGNEAAARQGIEWLKEQGFQVKMGGLAAQSWGYLAGRDEERAAELHELFADPAIDGIVCLRGGYGSMRLLELIDYELVRRNPKVFCGYSDITALHVSLGQKSGLVTFHGPMLASDMSREWPLYSQASWLKTVGGQGPLGCLENPEGKSWSVLAEGEGEGMLTGGNLSLLAATLGTPYEIDTAGKILCLEEVGEAPYRIDRLLTQLRLAGKLQQAAGIVVAVCSDCDDEEPPGFTLEEVLAERLGDLGLPVLSGLYFGHTSFKLTLPLGIKAKLSSAGLYIGETAVGK